MIKSWLEYITENVDPESFNCIIYLRTIDSPNQFWIYVNGEGDYFNNCVKVNSIAAVRDIANYLANDIDLPEEDLIFRSTDLKFIGNIQKMFDHDIMVYGLNYEGSQDLLINNLEDLADAREYNKKQGLSFQVVQIQLVEFDGDNFEIIDYYL